LLPSGSYDPDHAPGGQAEQSYGCPLIPALPDLVDDGTITLTPTLYGFSIDIGG